MSRTSFIGRMRAWIGDSFITAAGFDQNTRQSSVDEGYPVINKLTLLKNHGKTTNFDKKNN
jgi:hypothetical protein